MNHRVAITFLILATLATGPVLAQALPPPYMHYQGVLRDASGAPLDGTYDMEFRFYSFHSGGDYILRDLHVAFYGNPVTVAGGLFGVALGLGVMSDGSGSGTYTNLSQVFRDYAQVWLEVRIGGEILDPRIRILGAPYAMNADNLDGRNSSWYLNGSDGPQTKTGPLTVNSAGTADYGLTATGHLAAGHFSDAEDSGEAYLGHGNYGISALGSAAAGLFGDTDSSGGTLIAYGDRGVDAWGDEVGGYFWDSDDYSEAYVAYGNAGISAAGSEMGGNFDDSDDTGNAWVAYGNIGIQAQGSQMGGYFLNTTDPTRKAWLAGSYGVHAAIGGYSGVAGFFENTDYTRSVKLGSGEYALEVEGPSLFHSEVSFWEAGDWVKIHPIFEPGVGIHAKGDLQAGHFENDEDNSHAYIANGNYGVEAVGPIAGGYFHARNDTGYARCGYGDYGVHGIGDSRGGEFQDTNTSSFGYVGYSSYKVYGTGTMSFVQNHPVDPDRVIVYAAPEGDEVATYTRGTSRLVGGEARVSLGETFEWVTNPDIGLTAHLTARDEAVPLAVVELTTRELVVRAPEGSPDVVFDYLVHGLRIGFEESSIVQEKKAEAYIPSMKDHRDLYVAHPELQRFSALERFAGMREEIGLDRMPDTTASESLRASIEEYVHGVHALPEDPDSLPWRSDLDDVAVESVSEEDVSQESSLVPEVAGDEVETGLAVAMDTRPPSIRALTWLPSAEVLEPGDLVVLDPDRPGALVRATLPEDPAILGVVVESGRSAESLATDGVPSAVPVVHAGVVDCRVDANYGSIRPGDALTSSPTPGHAMFAAGPRSGTILGKALEPLDEGTGTIRVLVLLH